MSWTVTPPRYCFMLIRWDASFSFVLFIMSWFTGLLVTFAFCFLEENCFPRHWKPNIWLNVPSSYCTRQSFLSSGCQCVISSFDFTFWSVTLFKTVFILTRLSPPSVFTTLEDTTINLVFSHHLSVCASQIYFRRCLRCHLQSKPIRQKKDSSLTDFCPKMTLQSHPVLLHSCTTHTKLSNATFNFK